MKLILEFEPCAWITWCPKGHEFDYLVFYNEHEALNQMDEFNEILENEGDDWLYTVEPLVKFSDVKQQLK